MSSQPVAVTVDLASSVLEVRIDDRRQEVLETLAPLDDAQRAALVADVWTIGLRALMNAYKQAEESRLQDIGRSLRDDLDRQLGGFIERQQATFVQMLARYFDPRDGQVTARLEAFLRDGGELARTMDAYLAPERGALARTLARELGENSPLLRRLSATDSEGVICLLENKLHETLATSQAELTKALDPVAEDGAVARFLRALRQELEKADADRTAQLQLATKALDANDESSLLSRLMRETNAAKEAFITAMNPELPTSPLAILKSALSRLLEEHVASQQKAMGTLLERQATFERDVRELLVRLEERKSGSSKSPRGGFDFETAVLCFVQTAVQGAPVTVDATANTVGAKPNCKVGDQVLRFSSESKYEGAAVVIEAKHDAGYSVSKALHELELARGNRTASVGIFVMAKSHAPTAFPTLARYGNDILVMWDEHDEISSAYLHAAIILGLALSSQHARPEAAGDIEALADIEHRLHQELARLERMRKLSEAIGDNAEKIGAEIRKGVKAMDVLLRKAKETLLALDVVPVDLVDGTHEPVMLPGASLTETRAQLSAVEDGDRAMCTDGRGE